MDFYHKRNALKLSFKLYTTLLVTRGCIQRIINGAFIMEHIFIFLFLLQPNMWYKVGVCCGRLNPQNSPLVDKDFRFNPTFTTGTFWWQLLQMYCNNLIMHNWLYCPCKYNTMSTGSLVLSQRIPIISKWVPHFHWKGEGSPMEASKFRSDAILVIL